jgi:hypothetical protein
VATSANDALLADHVVELDSRGRISLGRLGRAGTQRYLARVEDDGTIVLQPPVVVSAFEARLLANPALVARIQSGLADDQTVEGDRTRHRSKVDRTRHRSKAS